MAFFGDTSTFNPTGGRAAQNTYYSNPDLVQQLAASLGGLQSNLTTQYQGLLQNPMASPLIQGQLGPLLQSFIPSENRARTAYTDAARSAGALRSGAYMRGLPQLEGELLGKRQQATGQLLGQAFPQLMQALQNPLGQISSLIDALKLSQGTGAQPGASSASSGGFGGLSPSLGLAMPLSSGGTSWDQLQQALYPSGGGATVGVNSGTTGGTAPLANNAGSYDLLQRLLGGGGTTFNGATTSGGVPNNTYGAYSTETAPGSGIFAY
jgi:hypothetical protein